MTESKEDSNHTFVGVDVSKKWLDIASEDGDVTRIANTASAWKDWLQRQAAGDEHIIVEATGGFERTVVDGCEASGTCAR